MPNLQVTGTRIYLEQAGTQIVRSTTSQNSHQKSLSYLKQHLSTALNESRGLNKPVAIFLAGQNRAVVTRKDPAAAPRMLPVVQVRKIALQVEVVFWLACVFPDRNFTYVQRGFGVSSCPSRGSALLHHL